MLGLKIVGSPKKLISEARQPQPRLQELLKAGLTDPLLAAMGTCLRYRKVRKSGVPNASFGVFGFYAAWFFIIQSFPTSTSQFTENRKR